MVTRRKRPQSVPDEEPSQPIVNGPSIQNQLRDCWEFAALGQYLFIFGTALNIPDNWSIEALENELLGTAPYNFISQIKMALLCSVSSHKGLVDDQFDDFARRQYLAKKPRGNPFGDDEQPTSFADLTVLAKVQVLHQLSQWSLIHADRLREKLGETDKEQQEWRVEPCGYDSQDNTYFLLDDNRLYQRTPMKVPSTMNSPKIPKKSTTRPSKRRRLTKGQEENEEEVPEDDPEKFMLESMKWRCVCATIEEYQEFIEQWKKPKDQNEKALRSYLIDDVLPVLHAAEEEKKKEEAARQRQLAIETAVANRKRSSRIDAKLARQREEEEKAEAERKRQEEIRAEKEATERAERIGRERESRLAARERRMREREGRISLARLETNKESGNDSDSTVAQGGRQFTRRRELEKKKLEEEQARAAEEWMFDCICGVHGNNYDDGTPQVACDKCEVWQHVACLNLSPGTENKEFVCDRCLYREKHTTSLSPAEGGHSLAPTSISPKITIKLKLPTVHYEDSPIRVVPDSRIPLSPRRSRKADTVQEQPSSDNLNSPPPNLSNSNGHTPLQPQAHDLQATDGVNRANGNTDAPPPPSQRAEGASPPQIPATPNFTDTLPHSQPPQQASEVEGLGKAGPRKEVQSDAPFPTTKSSSVTNSLSQEQTPLSDNTESNRLLLSMKLHATENF